MITINKGFEKSNIISLSINGSVTSDDIVILEDAIETKLNDFDTLRIITEMSDHKGWTFTGFIKDFFSKFRYAKKIERSAIIADDSWDDAAQLADQLTAGEMRRFSLRQAKNAEEWIRQGALTKK